MPELAVGRKRRPFRGLVAGAVVVAHAAHAAALHNPVGSARTFLGEAALPAIRSLNGAGAPTLLPALHRVVNAVWPGLIGPEAALLRGTGWSGARPTSRADPYQWGGLRLTGEGSASYLHSSPPALLHALRMRRSMDAAPHLNQARAIYPGGVLELDAAPTCYICQTRSWKWTKSRYL